MMGWCPHDGQECHFDGYCKNCTHEAGMENRVICGTCKYHEYGNPDDGWVCANRESEYYSDFIEYEDACDEWEGR